jgi:rfaE bifunctional protein kinase chain/domain
MEKEERLLEIITSFSKKNMAVVGDFILDDYSWGIDAYNPEKNAPRVNVKKIDYRMGGAGNAAANTASLISNNGNFTDKLNHSVSLFTVVGNDQYGLIAKSLANSIYSRIVIDKKGRSTTEDPSRDKKISMCCEQEGVTSRKSRVLREFPNGKINYELLLSWGDPEPGEYISEIASKKIFTLMYENFDGLLLSHYRKGVFEQEKIAPMLIQWAKNKDIPCVVDPKPNEDDPSNVKMFNGAEYFAPNILEASRIAGMKFRTPDEIPSGEYYSISRKVAKMMNCKGVVISCGDKGAVVFDSISGNFEEIPAIHVENPDVVGAGDTFSAALYLSLSSGSSVFEAAYIANKAAGLVVQKQGTSTISLDELVSHMESPTMSIKG